MGALDVPVERARGRGGGAREPGVVVVLEGGR